jgi:hypothetical protein
VTFGGNCLRARPPSRSRFANASSSYSIQLAFDDHRIHVIEHEVMVVNPSSRFWRTKAQVVDVHPSRNCGPLHAVRLGRVLNG